uniref:Uncharacterized protein n=1 Tax=Rhizophora mucronata TaxID=61149 RepID=A0A2P2QV56_RHIMU
MLRLVFMSISPSNPLDIEFPSHSRDNNRKVISISNLLKQPLCPSPGILSNTKSYSSYNLQNGSISTLLISDFKPRVQNEVNTEKLESYKGRRILHPLCT